MRVVPVTGTSADPVQPARDRSEMRDASFPIDLDSYRGVNPFMRMRHLPARSGATVMWFRGGVQRSATAKACR